MQIALNSKNSMIMKLLHCWHVLVQPVRKDCVWPAEAPAPYQRERPRSGRRSQSNLKPVLGFKQLFISNNNNYKLINNITLKIFWFVFWFVYFGWYDKIWYLCDQDENTFKSINMRNAFVKKTIELGIRRKNVP